MSRLWLFHLLLLSSGQLSCAERYLLCVRHNMPKRRSAVEVNSSLQLHNLTTPNRLLPQSHRALHVFKLLIVRKELVIALHYGDVP